MWLQRFFRFFLTEYVSHLGQLALVITEIVVFIKTTSRRQHYIIQGDRDTYSVLSRTRLRISGRLLVFNRWQQKLPKLELQLVVNKDNQLCSVVLIISHHFWQAHVHVF